MTYQSKQLGASGEELAAQFLLRKGYRILARNLKTRYGEIDILAVDENNASTLVIIEVKSKTGQEFGDPAEMVDRRKQLKLRSLADQIAEQYHRMDYRIDVITIDLSDTKPIINHIEDALS